jgi:tetratricopeptide (TPR) repeat protein
VGKKFFLCLLLCGSAAMQGVFADGRLARLYFEEGRKLAQEGLAGDALGLLDSALVFRPAYADALFLKSSLLSQKRETRLAALETARRAVQAPAWEFYSPGAGLMHLCRLLADMRSYGEALAFLDSLGAGAASPSIEEYGLRLRCYRGLGDGKKLAGTLAAALAAFPDEPAFLEFFFQTSDPLRPETVRRFELVKLEPEKHLPAIAAYIKSSGNSDGALRLAWDYFRADGNDPAVSCLLIEKALVDPRQEMERFVSFGGLGRMELLRKLKTALQPQYSGLLAGACAAFSGTVVLDADGDGVPEEEFLVKAGKPLQWKIDENQDGLDEVIVDFAEATFLPARVAYRSGGAGMVCVYADYPYVGEALYYEGPYPEVSAGNARRTLRSRILPGVLALPLISGWKPPAAEELSWLDYRLDRDFTALPGARVEGAAYMYEERDSGEPDYTQLVSLQGGKIRQIDIVWNAGGKSVVLHRIMFQDGKFAFGLRDLDRDGVFDARESYDGEGKLALVLVDTAGDGTADYAESFVSRMLGWDTDGDGAIDAREIREAGGVRLREYYGGAE